MSAAEYRIVIVMRIFCKSAPLLPVFNLNANMANMADCERCERQIVENDVPECSICGKRYHFDCSIQPGTWRNAKNKGFWRCHKCRTEKPPEDIVNVIATNQASPHRTTAQHEDCTHDYGELVLKIDFLTSIINTLVEKVETLCENQSRLQKLVHDNQGRSHFGESSRDVIIDTEAATVNKSTTCASSRNDQNNSNIDASRVAPSATNYRTYIRDKDAPLFTPYNETASATLYDNVIREQRERKRRSRNVVIRGIRSQGPKETVASLERLFWLLTKRHYTFEFSYRGEEKQDLTRNIVVKLSDEHARSEILRNAKTLRATEWTNVYISPDLTPSQAAQDYDLRQRLKTLRDSNPHSRYFIKKGRIQATELNVEETRLQPPPPPPSLFPLLESRRNDPTPASSGVDPRYSILVENRFSSLELPSGTDEE